METKESELLEAKKNSAKTTKKQQGIVDKTTKKQLGGATGKGFMPGVSGNPKGRPEGSVSLTSMIKAKLEQMSPDGKRKALEVLAENIIQDALENNNKMRQLIWNYVDGMPRQGIDIKGELKTIIDKEQIDELFKRRK